MKGFLVLRNRGTLQEKGRTIVKVSVWVARSPFWVVNAINGCIRFWNYDIQVLGRKKCPINVFFIPCWKRQRTNDHASPQKNSTEEVYELHLFSPFFSGSGFHQPPSFLVDHLPAVLVPGRLSSTFASSTLEALTTGLAGAPFWPGVLFTGWTDQHWHKHWEM